MSPILSFNFLRHRPTSAVSVFTFVFGYGWQGIADHSFSFSLGLPTDDSRCLSTSCPTNCDSCECSSCKPGFYGDTCSSPCPSSCYWCDKDSGLCLACADGYFLPEGEDVCKFCPINCKKCMNDSFCLDCDKGYKGTTCSEKCENCLKGTHCKKDNGYCLEGCREGLSGDSCNLHCDLRCGTCDRRNKNNCTECAHNRYGSNCSETCSAQCANNTCDEKFGKCANGCKTGFWGEKCQYRYEDYKAWMIVAVIFICISAFLALILIVKCCRERSGNCYGSSCCRQSQGKNGTPSDSEADL